MDAAGNLYGTTDYGGSSNYCNGDNGGCGIVFRLSPKTGGGWAETVLYVFRSTSMEPAGICPSAESPSTLPAISMAQLSSADLPPCARFRLRRRVQTHAHATGPWKETVLHTFADGPDGACPRGGVVLDSNGNLYGTAQQGGDLSACSAHGCGAVF